MINVKEVKYNEPAYYIPSFGNAVKVEICRIEGSKAVVKQYSKNQELREFYIPLEFVCSSAEYANRCKRAWENWRRKRKRR